MSWVYSPICIKLIKKTDGNEVHCLSGINVVLLDAGHKLLEYNLTISFFHPSRLKEYDLFVSSTSLITAENVIPWFKGEVEFNISVVDEEFKQFLDYFSRNGFSYLPSVQLNTGLQFHVLNLKVNHNLQDHRPIQFTTTSDYDQIEVLAYPFNLSNPILFSGMKLSGHINYITKFGYFTDVRFIDNITGGIVNKRNSSESLGLVMTDIKRINGDGDLVFVLSWNWIWSIISQRFPHNRYITGPMINKLMGNTLPVRVSERKRTSVVPIQITSVYKQTWGSCVVFNSEYLVTNYHVILPYLTYPTSTAMIYLAENDFVMVSRKDVFITTFKDIDLAFIKLPMQDQFRVVSSPNIKPMTYTTEYEIGDVVKSVGYGLFFSNKFVKPIESMGIVMVKKSVELQPDDDIKMPSLIVTSAPCWNGSSGGGLFKDDQFVGLICSNAQVKTFDVQTNDFQSEKVSDLCFILPVEVIIECFRLIKLKTTKFERSHNFKNLWNLVDTFSNYYIDTRDGKERKTKL